MVNLRLLWICLYLEMVVIFRLKRRFFFCKFYITASLFVVSLMIYFKIVEVSYNLVDNCLYKEPIDVVYTWVNGSDPDFLTNLASFLKGKNESIDSSKQRFDDKYELKFSLRSLEKYAPWVNHVYIVTNGQIPYWLNLDYEKVSVITHDQIFRDSINLPSFSSPAIECNLHRIPGLSKRFIYFNDDIFLGEPTYLEDFYAPNTGFLIYLAWPVPQCAHSCPWMYVADGQCDKDCFVSECQMDGGDCSNLQDMTVVAEVSTEDGDAFVGEDLNQNQMLVDTIQKVRANFYKSFIKKLMPADMTHIQTIATVNLTNNETYSDLLKVFNLNDMRNLSKFVNEYNQSTLKDDKLRRQRLKRHKKRSLHTSNISLLEKLHQNINIDAYSASLQHTNRMLNTQYGFKTRKVPSHAPILIDKEIMEELQKTFVNEFTRTERNRVRREDDVQFSFSYYYFLISETVKRSVENIFDEFDTDFSKKLFSTWSDREIRTLLTKMYELPLSYAVVDHFEAMLLNCSESLDFTDMNTPPYERYIDSKLPTISKNLITSCPSLSKILTQRFGLASKYKYDIIYNSENKYVIFKMLNSNVSDVVSNLDDIRSNKKKFICLNDNLDESKVIENDLVKVILYDFYLSLFPQPSRFELPEDYKNKFINVKDLDEWKQYHYSVKICVYCSVLFVLCLIFYNLCKKKCCQFINKVLC